MRNRMHRNFARFVARRRAGVALRLQGWRPIVAFLAIFAVALQSFIVQTHIHNPKPALSLILAKSGDASTSGTTDGKFSSSDDAANCRLCQELVYAGRFVAPSTTLLVLPAIVAWLLIVFTHSATIPRARAYVWRSRAPPAHS